MSHGMDDVQIFLSSESGSWVEGKEDCRSRGADLVVIDSDEVLCPDLKKSTHIQLILVSCFNQLKRKLSNQVATFFSASECLLVFSGVLIFWVLFAGKCGSYSSFFKIRCLCFHLT